MEIMRENFSRLQRAINLLLVPALPFIARTPVFAQKKEEIRVDEKALGFEIPSFGEILTFIIKTFFVVAGIFALIFLLLGAFAWITSGGDKDKVEKARDKIQNALVGVILIVIVVAIIATLEQVVFGQRLCFGLTCDLTIPELLKAPKAD